MCRYTTDGSYKEFEQMRIAMEPLTYAAGVDVFFYGHVHAYERSTPVYNYTVDTCSAVHITIGVRQAISSVALLKILAFYLR